MRIRRHCCAVGWAPFLLTGPIQTARVLYKQHGSYTNSAFVTRVRASHDCRMTMAEDASLCSPDATACWRHFVHRRNLGSSTVRACWLRAGDGATRFATSPIWPNGCAPVRSTSFTVICCALLTMLRRHRPARDPPPASQAPTWVPPGARRRGLKTRTQWLFESSCAVIAASLNGENND